MKILITGAAGYIGSQLVNTLTKNHELICVDNFMYDNYNVFNHLDIHIRNIDVTKEDISEYLDWAECVIPLAAMVGQKACDEHPEKAEAVNYWHIKNIVDYIEKDKLLIFPNTNSGYGKTNFLCDETTPLNPVSWYGKTKQRAEEYILEHHKKSIVLRLATVFGVSPRMRTDLLVNDLTWQGITGMLEIFEPNASRNFVHISDVCSAISTLVWSGKNHGGPEVYNLGNDSENMSKIDLARKVKHVTDCAITMCEGSDPDQRDYRVSSKKILKDRKIECKTEVITGIKELFAYYKRIGKGKDSIEFSKIMRSMQNGNH